MSCEGKEAVDFRLVTELLSGDALAIDCSGKVNIVALQFSGSDCGGAVTSSRSGSVFSRYFDESIGHSILLSRLPSGSDDSDLLSLTIKDFIDFVRAAGKKLSAIALGQGPGSFTGLRIATALAQGLAYGLKIPLIECSSFSIASFAIRGLSGAEGGEVNDGGDSDGYNRINPGISHAIVRSAGKGSWFYSQVFEKSDCEKSECQYMAQGDASTSIGNRALGANLQLTIELLSDEQLQGRAEAHELVKERGQIYAFEGEECSLIKTTPVSSQIYGENIFKALRSECEKTLKVELLNTPLLNTPLLNTEPSTLKPQLKAYSWNEVHQAMPLYLRPVAAKSLKDRGLA